MSCSGCSALHGFNPDQKKTEIRSQLINLNLIFFIRPIEKSVLAIHDINGLSKITNLLDIKKSGTCRSSSPAPEVLLWKRCSENMLIRAYNLITNKIRKSFNMVLLSGINNSSRYIKKYTNILVTIPSNHLQRIYRRICSTFTGENPCQSAIWMKLQRSCELHIFRTPFPKTPWYSCFCA